MDILKHFQETSKRLSCTILPFITTTLFVSTRVLLLGVYLSIPVTLSITAIILFRKSAVYGEKACTLIQRSLAFSEFLDHPHEANILVKQIDEQRKDLAITTFILAQLLLAVGIYLTYLGQGVDVGILSCVLCSGLVMSWSLVPVLLLAKAWDRLLFLGDEEGDDARADYDSFSERRPPSDIGGPFTI